MRAEVYAMAPMKMISITTKGKARSVTAAARTVAGEGRTATAANVAGSAVKMSKSRVISTQPTAR